VCLIDNSYACRLYFSETVLAVCCQFYIFALTSVVITGNFWEISSNDKSRENLQPWQ